jgi:hypothetical protein
VDRKYASSDLSFSCWSLIDAATLTFDEILAPVREGFRKSGVTEEELDAALAGSGCKVRYEKHLRGRPEIVALLLKPIENTLQNLAKPCTQPL